MLENIIFSPICLVTKEEDRQYHLQAIVEHNFIMAKEYNKGELFIEMRVQLPKHIPLIGIMIAIGYIKNYEA